MSILSYEFLIFTAAVAAVSYLFPLKYRWLALTAASVIFLALDSWQSLAHLTAVALLTWLGGLALTAMKDSSPARRRLVLTAALVLDLGAMVFIKFEPSAARWINAAAGERTILPIWELAVPLGLSYYTFQSAGLLIDIYRGKAEARKDPLKVWLFAGYFPQLVQGPISGWKELGGQLLTGHRFEPEQLLSGFQLMLWGYFKKLVIADRIAPVTTAVLKAETLPGWLAAFGLAAYAVRLYADFSGGMDVVRGVSRMLGIELPENFRRPFFSQSVAEYWRRWHITLGTWFRSYLLYPLTTSRMGIALGRGASRLFGKKTGRMIPSALATLLVFLLIGIWHTANWNAVLYGAYFGILMAASMLLEPVWKNLNRSLKLPKNGWMKPVRLLRTWLIVVLAQAFAFTSGPAQAMSVLGALTHSWSFAGFAQTMTEIMTAVEWLILGIGLLVLLAVDIACECRKDLCGGLARGPFWLRWPVLWLLILAILVFGIYGVGFDSTAFVYAQF